VLRAHGPDALRRGGKKECSAALIKNALPERKKISYHYARKSLKDSYSKNRRRKKKKHPCPFVVRGKENREKGKKEEEMSAPAAHRGRAFVTVKDRREKSAESPSTDGGGKEKKRRERGGGYATPGRLQRKSQGRTPHLLGGPAGKGKEKDLKKIRGPQPHLPMLASEETQTRH